MKFNYGKDKTFEVIQGNTYVILDKINGDTPPELHDLGLSRIVSKGFSGDCAVIPSVLDKYDLGIDLTSIDFRGMTTEAKKQALEDRKDYIEKMNLVYGDLVKNTKSVYGQDTAFDTWKFGLAHNTIIDTTSDDKFLDVCMAMRTGLICPRSLSDGSLFPNAQYVIECQEEAEVDFMNSTKNAYTCMQVFAKLVKENKSFLVDILNYFQVGHQNTLKTKEFEMYGKFQEWVKVSLNSTKFLTTLKINDQNEVSISRDEKLKIVVTAQVSSLINEGKITHSDDGYVLSNWNLGKTRTEAVNKILEEPELRQRFSEMAVDSLQKPQGALVERKEIVSKAFVAPKKRKSKTGAKTVKKDKVVDTLVTA